MRYSAVQRPRPPAVRTQETAVISSPLLLLLLLLLPPPHHSRPPPQRGRALKYTKIIEMERDSFDHLYRSGPSCSAWGHEVTIIIQILPTLFAASPSHRSLLPSPGATSGVWWPAVCSDPVLRQQQRRLVELSPQHSHSPTLTNYFR